MSSCVCKISFKSVQVCSGCCKMFRGLTFLGTQCTLHSPCDYVVPFPKYFDHSLSDETKYYLLEGNQRDHTSVQAEKSTKWGMEARKSGEGK